MRNICFIANKYPGQVEPNANVFYQQLIWSMADRGVKCRVVAPVAVDLVPKYLSHPFATVETTENGNAVEVYWPKYFGLGDEHRILGWSPARFSADRFTAAARRAII